MGWEKSPLAPSREKIGGTKGKKVVGGVGGEEGERGF